MATIILEEGQDIAIVALERELDEQRTASDQWGDALALAEEEQSRLLAAFEQNRLALEHAHAMIAEHDANVLRLGAIIRTLGSGQ